MVYCGVESRWRPTTAPPCSIEGCLNERCRLSDPLAAHDLIREVQYSEDPRTFTGLPASDSLINDDPDTMAAFAAAANCAASGALAMVWVWRQPRAVRPRLVGGGVAGGEHVYAQGQP